jgi:hypothetical protein
MEKIKSYDDFFIWCRSHGLHNDKIIAIAFGITPQTIRNWRIKLNSEVKESPPEYLNLICIGYECCKAKTGEIVPAFPRMTMELFEEWRVIYKLDTLEDTGKVFGRTRQAIHNWKKRFSLPRWLPLACIGYEIIYYKK